MPPLFSGLMCDSCLLKRSLSSQFRQLVPTVTYTHTHTHTKPGPPMSQHTLPLTLPSPVHVLPLHCTLSSSAGGKSNVLLIPELFTQVRRHGGSTLMLQKYSRARTRTVALPSPHHSAGLTVGCDGGFVMRMRINPSTPAAPDSHRVIQPALFRH